MSGRIVKLVGISKDWDPILSRMLTSTAKDEGRGNDTQVIKRVNEDCDVSPGPAKDARETETETFVFRLTVDISAVMREMLDV